MNTGINIMLRIAMVIVFFFAAIACYVFGIPAGGAVFIVLGLVFEGLFWVGIFGKSERKRKTA